MVAVLIEFPVVIYIRMTMLVGSSWYEDKSLLVVIVSNYEENRLLNEIIKGALLFKICCGTKLGLQVSISDKILEDDNQRTILSLVKLLTKMILRDCL